MEPSPRSPGRALGVRKHTKKECPRQSVYFTKRMLSLCSNPSLHYISLFVIWGLFNKVLLVTVLQNLFVVKIKMHEIVNFYPTDIMKKLRPKCLTFLDSKEHQLWVAPKSKLIRLPQEQISANRGPNSRFHLEVNTKALISKSNSGPLFVHFKLISHLHTNDNVYS